MPQDPIRAILLAELDTVSSALNDLEPTKNQDEFDAFIHWSERLRDVNHAFQSLEQVIHVTQQERATLRLILEFHEGNFDGEEADCPFDLRAYETLLDKVRPGVKTQA
jgi:hypothetical protein